MGESVNFVIFFLHLELWEVLRVYGEGGVGVGGIGGKFNKHQTYLIFLEF